MQLTPTYQDFSRVSRRFVGDLAAHNDENVRDIGKTLLFAMWKHAPTKQRRRRAPRCTGACVNIHPSTGFAGTRWLQQSGGTATRV